MSTGRITMSNGLLWTRAIVLIVGLSVALVSIVATRVYANTQCSQGRIYGSGDCYLACCHVIEAAPGLDLLWCSFEIITCGSIDAEPYHQDP